MYLCNVLSLIMAIQPFPSQDLAKLVLGYLAEEQLMTAYDEFLQASPYLDALRNEYDRIFMTSLRNILAEYRAVKIYVESCKPITLRKKIFQCTNMLEVVKVLISLIDINKLDGQDFTIDKVSSAEQNVLQKVFACDACNSSNLASCVCNCKNSNDESITTQTPSEIEAATLETSIETTPLSELPGNTVTDENPPKVISSLNVTNLDLCDIEIEEKESQKENTSIDNPCLPPAITQHNASDQIPSSSQTASLEKLNETKENTVESDISNQYISVKNNNVSAKRKRRLRNSVNVTNNLSKDIPNAASFQDFATGVTENEKYIVNLSDLNMQHQILTPTYLHKTSINNDNAARNEEEPLKNCTPLHKCNISIEPGFKNTISETEKSEQKITILSNVKVNDLSSTKNPTKMSPPVLQTATSTPLLPTHKIFINGTPVYKNKSQTTTQFSYTKDEIMAMPTIILMPVSGVAQKSSLTRQRLMKNPVAKPSSSVQRLGPLIIDVASSSVPTQVSPKSKPKKPSKDNNTNGDCGLVKTIDLTHASLPKDVAIANIGKTTTPNALPPARKSSSTPRRTSHVRVLDFNTPRRILNVSNNELNSNKDIPSDVVHKALQLTLNTVHESNKVDNDENANINNLRSSISDCSLLKENKVLPKNKFNWDRDLRALAVKNDDDIEIYRNKSTPISESKKNYHKKRQTSQKIVSSHNKTKSPLSLNNKHSIKANKTKSKLKTKEVADESNNKDIKYSEPIIPTINVIAGNDWSEASPQVNENKDKTEDDAQLTDTPEMDRISLQNEIGAKLNLCELLETPYKQVLYDIQMETPRFLGPDLPDAPMSDIKIMNIPTPKFFDTSKPTQATPPSYSSRPTDYSSGGSYYNPDDQDYIPLAEVLKCKTIVKDKLTNENIEKNVEGEQCSIRKVEKPKRPVRKCAENVSYRTPKKMKDDENYELSSEGYISEKKSNKPKGSKSALQNKLSTNCKSECDKKSAVKGKSNIKKGTPKTFLKIKPRKITPIKYTISSKGIKKAPDYNYPIPLAIQSRKRTNSKEKSISNCMPIVAPVTTKSRRKSATPRKLHCTKSFNESSDNNSSDKTKSDHEVTLNSKDYYHQNTDTEQLPLQWSDVGSQDSKAKGNKSYNSQNEDDDISKIKEYIATSVLSSTTIDRNNDGSLHNDLVMRGFDVDTAKSIERDLLDTPPRIEQRTSIKITTDIHNSLNLGDEKYTDRESLQKNDADDDETDEDYVELSVSECCESSRNYVSYYFDESIFTPNTDLPKLKETFSMELCMDDGISIRLRATALDILLDREPEDTNYNTKETESAVSSISNIDKLYTPLKDPKVQCHEIFDSTLTSLDTPIKENSSTEKEYNTTVTEIVLEVDNFEVRDKMETRKRKRLSGVIEESISTTKKSKSDAQYLLSSANIQNMDIESVLSKLHGP